MKVFVHALCTYMSPAPKWFSHFRKKVFIVMFASVWKIMFMFPRSPRS